MEATVLLTSNAEHQPANVSQPGSQPNDEDGQDDENDANDARTTVVAAGDGHRKLSILGLSGELEDLTVHFEDDFRRALDAAELASGEVHVP